MFDPYRDWLGISEERRPPTLYQLLAIHPAEADPRTIEAAVSRQLAKVQAQLTGAKSKEAWQLVDEITLAKSTLLDPVKRAAYDGIFGIAGAKPVPPRSPAPPPAPMAPTGWPQQAPGPGPGWPMPPRATPPPPPAMAYPQPPSPPAVTAFNPLEDHDPPSAEGLPSVTAIKRPNRSSSNTPILILGGGLIALGVVAAIILLKGKGGNQPDDVEKKQTEVAENAGEAKTAPNRSKKDDPKDTQPKFEPPKKKEPKKVVVVKKQPDPPPRVEADDEFKQAMMLRGHAITPRTLAVAPDGKQLLSGGGDGAINSWVPNSDKPSRRKSLAEGTAAVGVAFLRDGKDAVIADPGALYVIDLATNMEKMKAQSPNGSIEALAASSDGQHFMTCSSDGQLRWWDATKDAPEKTIDATGGIPLQCVALTPDGKIAIGGTRGTAASSDGLVSVWNIANGTQVKQWKAHSKDVTALAVSPDGKRLLTTGADLLGKVWDLLSGTLLLTLKGHEDVPVAAAYSFDGAMILTAGVDMTIRSWDAKTGEPLRWSFKSDAKVFALALDPKNRFLIAGLSDGGIQVLLLPIVRPDSPAKELWVAAPKSPLPPPLPSAVESTVKSVRDKYGNDYAQTDPVEQLALFDKLLTRANHADDEPPLRFALFLEARDLAGKLGRMPDAIKAIDARSRWFETDELEDKAQALKAAAQGMINKSVVETAVSVVEEAEKQVRFDVVNELLLLNELFPQADDATEVNKRIEAAKKRWMGAAADRDASRKLATEWKTNPEDPAVNGQYGKYLCFRVGDWNEGLPKLVKGEDAALRMVATLDLADPKDAKGQIDLGKAWLEYAPKADESFRPGILLRAKHWLDKALANNLPPAEKLPVGTRLVEINKQLTALGNVTLARPGEPVTRKNFNTIRSDAAVESQWIIVGSDGYMPEGIVLKADASLLSRFKLLDKSRIEFVFVPDGREIKMNLYGEQLEFKPTADSTPVHLSVERKADQLLVALKSFTGTVLEEKSIKLAPAKQMPTPISFGVAGPAGTGEMKIKTISVSGPVKPME